MITYCQMTQNRLHETKECVERALPYVDRVVIVDGGSLDDTIFYMRNWETKEPKLEFHVYPWEDHFPRQRNNYLKHVPDNTWALVSDPDEVFEQPIFEQLSQLINEAERRKKNMIGFRCRSVSFKGPERVWENVDNYWKRLLFKKFPGTAYDESQNPHERLTNHPLKIMDVNLIYEHRKQENVIWHRGARNLFCGGGGPNLGDSNKRWIDLRSICSELGLHTWHQFDAYLIRGNIDARIKAWMYSYKDVDGWDGASEHREVWKLYFQIYHPEEQQ